MESPVSGLYSKNSENLIAAGWIKLLLIFTFVFDNIIKVMVVWQKCHAESAARFDKLSDRKTEEEPIFPHR